MKRLYEIITSFKEHIEYFNKHQKGVLEDDIEMTFENFYKWLAFEYEKLKDIK